MTDDYEGWPTTRCFPRTTNEAFRDDVDNAKWWYPPEKTWQDRALFWTGMFLWGVLAVYFWRAI
jgi:hypothetical protein